MKHAVDAIFENGVFRPIHREAITIAEGQRVRITIDDCEPPALQQLMRVYDGLSEDDIREIERISLQRGGFLRVLANPAANR
jgi:predicted DNA-binding antitoxin AbrB/MazE fold protein